MKKNYLIFFIFINLICFLLLGCSVQGSSSGGGSSGDDEEKELTPGTFDTSFNNDGNGASGTSIDAITIQSDGKIIIGGYFSSYNNVSKNNLARLNPNGTIDTSFNYGISGATETDGAVSAIALQSDGKIVIGGKFTFYNATYTPNFARINSNGAYDFSFNTVNGPNFDILSVAIQSDGKILIGGFFTSYNGTAINRIARINTDGTLDISFNPGTGPDKPVESIAIQPDGKILIVGGFTTYNSTSINYIARLNTNGSLDTSLNPIPGADDMINTVALQSDGKILVGGWFTSYDGVSRNRIARLLTDGSFDPLFNPGTGVNGTITYVTEIVLQSDGKILVGGDFTTYSDISRNNIVRLNTNGSLDTLFDIGTGLDDGVSSIVLQPGGKIIIGGYFTHYNGIACNRIARLIGN